MTESDFDNMRMTVPELCRMAEELGYNEEPRQLQHNNGAYVSSLCHFLEDNPGAMEVLVEWARDNYAEEDEEESDEDE